MKRYCKICGHRFWITTRFNGYKYVLDKIIDDDDESLCFGKEFDMGEKCPECGEAITPESLIRENNQREKLLK